MEWRRRARVLIVLKQHAPGGARKVDLGDIAQDLGLIDRRAARRDLEALVVRAIEWNSSSTAAPSSTRSSRLFKPRRRWFTGEAVIPSMKAATSRRVTSVAMTGIDRRPEELKQSARMPGSTAGRHRRRRLGRRPPRRECPCPRPRRSTNSGTRLRLLFIIGCKKHVEAARRAAAENHGN